MGWLDRVLGGIKKDEPKGPTYSDLFQKWGIPDVTQSAHFGKLKDVATRGLGSDYEYGQAFGAARGAAAEGRQQREEQGYKMHAAWGSGFNVGAAGRVEAISRAGVGAKVGQALMAAQSSNEQARAEARNVLLSTLMSYQGTIANVMGTYRSLQTQKELKQQELEAMEDSGGSFIVGAEYGMTSAEEEFMLIWKRLMIKLSYRKPWRKKFWRAIFAGYHRASPWVVRQSKRARVLLAMRKALVDNFVRYVLCDILQHRRKRVRERVAAATMCMISLCGWRFNNG